VFIFYFLKSVSCFVLKRGLVVEVTSENLF